MLSEAAAPLPSHQRSLGPAHISERDIRSQQDDHRTHDCAWGKGRINSECIARAYIRCTHTHTHTHTHTVAFKDCARPSMAASRYASEMTSPDSSMCSVGSSFMTAFNARSMYGKSTFVAACGAGKGCVCVPLYEAMAAYETRSGNKHEYRQSNTAHVRHQCIRLQRSSVYNSITPQAPD